MLKILCLWGKLFNCGIELSTLCEIIIKDSNFIRRPFYFKEATEKMKKEIEILDTTILEKNIKKFLKELKEKKHHNIKWWVLCKKKVTKI